MLHEQDCRNSVCDIILISPKKEKEKETQQTEGNGVRIDGRRREETKKKRSINVCVCLCVCQSEICVNISMERTRSRDNLCMVTMRQAPHVGGNSMSASSHCTYCRGVGGRGEAQGREEVCWEVRHFIDRAVYTEGG